MFRKTRFIWYFLLVIYAGKTKTQNGVLWKLNYVHKYFSSVYRTFFRPNIVCARTHILRGNFLWFFLSLLWIHLFSFSSFSKNEFSFYFRTLLTLPPPHHFEFSIQFSLCSCTLLCFSSFLFILFCYYCGKRFWKTHADWKSGFFRIFIFTEEIGTLREKRKIIYCCVFVRIGARWVVWNLRIRKHFLGKDFYFTFSVLLKSRLEFLKTRLR